jgi:hypothetical protein
MRLVIEFDEKYEHLFFELVIATKSTIVDVQSDLVTDYPEHVRKGIEKGLEQARNGQTKTYAEVKKILAERFPKIKRPVSLKNKPK